MAYSDMTYEVIMQRMMNRVAENHPNIDLREGSIVFNALASAAIELSIAYAELSNTRDESFVATASREGILQGCKDIGMDVSIFEASAGVHKGEFNVEVPIGSRWNCGLYNYVVTEFVEVNESNYYVYNMDCEASGSAPNNITGDLTAITDMPSDLTYAKVVECVIEGEDETSDEDIVTAYYNFVGDTKVDGNLAQYKQWCEEYDGVGNYKIIPLWNGDNTVKVSILSASNQVASDELIAEFQEYLDPNVSGMGDGVAPIGAFVTVSTATPLSVSISAHVKMKPNYNDTQPISDAVSAYFSAISYAKTSVPYMNVGSVILSVEGVESVSDLLINEGTVDITLGTEQIPFLEAARWVVD